MESFGRGIRGHLGLGSSVQAGLLARADPGLPAGPRHQLARSGPARAGAFGVDPEPASLLAVPGPAVSAVRSRRFLRVAPRAAARQRGLGGALGRNRGRRAALEPVAAGDRGVDRSVLAPGRVARRRRGTRRTRAKRMAARDIRMGRRLPDFFLATEAPLWVRCVERLEDVSVSTRDVRCCIFRGHTGRGRCSIRSSSQSSPVCRRFFC